MIKHEPTYAETVERFIADLREIRQLHDVNFEQVNIKDKEEGDIRHAIEFEPHYKARARLSTQLHRVRIERRRAKNFTMAYDPVVAFLEKNGNLMDKLGLLLGLLRKADEQMERHREYRPRVRDDLTYGEEKQA